MKHIKKLISNKADLERILILIEPKEIWWDTFSKDEPYIVIYNYVKGLCENFFRGQYTEGVLLVARECDYKDLFKEGMYIKIPIVKV